MSHAYNTVLKLKKALLDQTAPVQNTWYTVLNTAAFVRLYSVVFRVNTTGENLEVKLTMDGETVTHAIAAVADAHNYLILYMRYDGWQTLVTATATSGGTLMVYDVRSLKVEIRKTSAAGAGTIRCGVAYSQV